MKAQLGKLELPVPWQVMLKNNQEEDGFEVLPLALSHLINGEELPLHHRDPFDRLLINQSQVEGLPIISVDNQFSKYEVDVIW